MKLNCFYCNYGTDEDVSAPDYIVVNPHAASKIARLVLVEKDDFFGLVNSEGQTIQFIVDDFNLVTIDMPIKMKDSDEFRSHQGISDLTEVEKIIAKLPKSFAGLEKKLKLTKVVKIKPPHEETAE